MARSDTDERGLHVPQARSCDQLVVVVDHPTTLGASRIVVRVFRVSIDLLVDRFSRIVDISDRAQESLKEDGTERGRTTVILFGDAYERG